VIFFDVALIVPLLTLNASDTVKITLGVISSSWIRNRFADSYKDLCADKADVKKAGIGASHRLGLRRTPSSNAKKNL